MELVVTTAAIRLAKAPVKMSQSTNIQFFLPTGCPSCRPTNSVKALMRYLPYAKFNVMSIRPHGWSLKIASLQKLVPGIPPREWTAQNLIQCNKRRVLNTISANATA